MGQRFSKCSYCLLVKVILMAAWHNAVCGATRSLSQNTSSSCVQEFGKCGTIKWTETKCCNGHLECVAKHRYYAQCLSESRGIQKTLVNGWDGTIATAGMPLSVDIIHPVEQRQRESEIRSRGFNPPPPPPPPGTPAPSPGAVLEAGEQHTQFCPPSSRIWINEIFPADDGELFVEVAGLIGEHSSGWSLQLSSGPDPIADMPLPEMESAGNLAVATVYPSLPDNVQPDTFVLISPSVGVVQSISLDEVGVEADTQTGQSIGLTGSGCQPNDFYWAPMLASPGVANEGQVVFPRVPTIYQ